MEKGKSDSSFLYTGLKNWKYTTVTFKEHQLLITHKILLQFIVKMNDELMLVKYYPQAMLKRKETTSVQDFIIVSHYFTSLPEGSHRLSGLSGCGNEFVELNDI